MAQNPDAFRLPFDGRCTVWTTFLDLKVDDEVDYWGAACPVIDWQQFEGDPVRVRIIVQQQHGQQMALAPSYEGTWRVPRADEEGNSDGAAEAH
jgi:hypothetical protein